MIIFHSDLDNTLIYSYKHDIGKDKVCAEIYQEREISFMTKKSYELLKKVNEKVLIVPTTTRTKEQYDRIFLGVESFKYALVCNGGVLLINGMEDEKWYRESLELTANAQKELEKAKLWLEKDINTTFEVRNIKDLFVFTKSSKPEYAKEGLEKLLDLSVVEVLLNGVKVYVMPKSLNKGEAVKRFKNRMSAGSIDIKSFKAEHVDKIIAAGDSLFDIAMLKQADTALMPANLAAEYGSAEHKQTVGIAENEIFSEYLLNYIVKAL